MCPTGTNHIWTSNKAEVAGESVETAPLTTDCDASAGASLAKQAGKMAAACIGLVQVNPQTVTDAAQVVVHQVRTADPLRRLGACRAMIRNLACAGSLWVESAPSAEAVWINHFKFESADSRSLLRLYRNTVWLRHTEPCQQCRWFGGHPKQKLLDPTEQEYRKARADAHRANAALDEESAEEAPVEGEKDSLACAIHVHTPLCVQEARQRMRHQRAQDVFDWNREAKSFKGESWSSEQEQIVKEANKYLRAMSEELNQPAARAVPKTFKKLQLDTIVAAAHNPNCNVVAHLPTGYGKTLIAHIVAHMAKAKGQVTLMVVPLVALKEEQVERAEQAGLKCVRLDGGNLNKTAEQMEDILLRRKAADDDATASVADIIFLTPEMWSRNGQVRNGIRQLARDKRLGRVVLDEAHVLADCGEGFRDEYRQLGSLLMNEAQQPVLALTASLNPDTLTTLQGDLRLLPRRDLFLREKADSHLRNHVISVHPKSSERDYTGLVKAVKEELGGGPDKCGIVFALQKPEARRVRDALAAALEGIECQLFTAAIDQKQKTDIRTGWVKGKHRLVVATGAFGLGIDKQNVDFVFHSSAPLSMCTLQQHLGRARDSGGKKISCRIFWHHKDRIRAKSTLRLPHVDAKLLEQAKADKVNEVFQFIHATCACRRNAVIAAALPDSHDQSECAACGMCDGCERASQGSTALSTAVYDVANILKQVVEQHPKSELSESQLISCLDEVTPFCDHPGLSCRVVTAATCEEVLRPEKYGTLKYVRGQNWDKLGDSDGQLRLQVELLDHDPAELAVTTEGHAAENDGTFEVESIRGARLRRGIQQYECHWKGYGSGDDSWEPVENMKGAEEMIKAYEQQQEEENRQKRGKRLKCVQGLDPPGRLIQTPVSKWNWRIRWCVESRISEGLLTWDAISSTAASQLLCSQQDPAAALARFLMTLGCDDGWRGLPAVGSALTLLYRASVKYLRKSHKLQWLLDWPEKVCSDQGRDAGHTKRIFCHYGSENVLFVQIHPKQMGEDGVEAFQQLHSNELELGGRKWRRPKLKMDKSGNTLVFFAKTAVGSDKAEQARFQRALDQVNSRMTLDWHFPLTKNKDKTLCKALNRFKLCQSTMVPTVQLKENQIIPIDTENWSAEDWSDYKKKDGACGIAPDLLEQVYTEWIEKTGGEDKGFRPPPTQLRILFLKGMWFADPSVPSGCIMYMEHQKKFELDRPTQDQLVIEVCSFCEDSGPAEINTQFIVAMEPRLKRPELLVELMTEQLHRDLQALKSPEACRRFCTDKKSGGEGRKVLEHLNSNFDWTSELVQSGIRRALKRYAEGMFNEGVRSKLNIRVPKSRRLKMIYDKSGLLQDGEMVMKCPMVDPFVSLCILMRNPCYSPGELLLTQAKNVAEVVARANTPEERSQAQMFFDAQPLGVILPVKTQRELGVADKMQGGDYDGDEVVVLWDQRFTDGFKTDADWCQPPEYSDPIPDPLANKKVGDYELGGDDLDDALREIFRRNIRKVCGGPNEIQRCSMLHSAWADKAGTDWGSEAGRNALILGDLAHKAVDLPAAGHQVVIPERLTKIARPRYVLSVDKEQGVYLGDLGHSAGETVDARRRTERELQQRFEDEGYESVCRPWVSTPTSEGWVHGFVSFRVQEDHQKALETGEIQLGGRTVTIRKDTRQRTQAAAATASKAFGELATEERVSTSVVRSQLSCAAS
jgi:superfamily II DNA helicase RecQ